MSKKEEVLAVVNQSNRADGEVELSQAVIAVEREANEITIKSDEEYKQAAEFGKALKQKSDEVLKFFAPLKKAAHEAHKQICDREKAMLNPIANAEKALKKAMGEYYIEVERKKREREEMLRALAKAEEERLMAEAIKMEEQGENEMAEEHFENAQFMATAKRAISVPSATPKAGGVTTTIDWEIESVDPALVPVSFGEYVFRPVDEKAVLKFIRANKGNVEIPGIKFRATQKISFRK